MQITETDKQSMIKTARSRGAVGKNAILPKFISEIRGLEDHLVLDFGCGKDAVHVQILRKKGFAYVYGVDLVPITDPNLTISNGSFLYVEALPWHLVYASNVLNVQPSFTALRCTICKVSDYARVGVAFLSYPKSPRKLNIGKDEMLSILAPYFKSVTSFRYRNTTIFKCTGRKCQEMLERRLTLMND